jgi:cobalt-zinc-cadmium efflux system protein
MSERHGLAQRHPSDEHTHPPHAHAAASHAHAGGEDSHAHAHHRDASERRLLAALLILGAFTLVEAVGGYLARSLALLAESAHMLADAAALVLAVFAVRVSRRPADRRRTYGHRRYQPLAAFVNGQVLLLLTAWVVYAAVMRLLHPRPVNGQLMLVIAIIGGLANLGAFLALSGARSLNERSARVHVLSDLLGSGAASVAALLVLLAGWTMADPLLSLVVSALIFRSAWALTRQSADVLLECAPAGLDVQQIELELVGHVPGLTGIHHVHVWSITGERPTVTLHANLVPGTRHAEAIAAIHTRLGERLRVEHTTVQIEEEGCCDTPCGSP